MDAGRIPAGTAVPDRLDRYRRGAAAGGCAPGPEVSRQRQAFPIPMRLRGLRGRAHGIDVRDHPRRDPVHRVRPRNRIWRKLARLRGTSTAIGAHLDFLMDELKAFLLVAAVGVRLWRADGQATWLLESLLALVAVASAISLTTFLRRPEYAAATGAKMGHGRGDYGEGFAGETAAEAPAPRGPPPARSLSVKRVIEAAGSFVVHYPSYLVFVAICDRMDCFFTRIYSSTPRTSGARCWASPGSWAGGAHEGHHRCCRARAEAGTRDRRHPEVHGLGRRQANPASPAGSRWRPRARRSS